MSDKEYSTKEVAEILQKMFPDETGIGPSWVSWCKVSDYIVPTGKTTNRLVECYTADDVLCLVILRILFKHGYHGQGRTKILKQMCSKIRKKLVFGPNEVLIVTDKRADIAILDSLREEKVPQPISCIFLVNIRDLHSKLEKLL